MDFKFAKRHWPLAASLGWLVAISCFTVFKYAPAGVNADIVMNSIMSLQKITIFYWGQTRLANFLPLLVSPIRDPATNFSAVLLISSLSFFAMLLLMARFAAEAVTAANDAIAALKIFVAISTLSLLMLQPPGIAALSVGHIEYGMAALLFGAGVYILWHHDAESWKAKIWPGLLIFIAMGLNPSTLLVGLFLVAARIIYLRRLENGDRVLTIMSLAAFVIWYAISLAHWYVPYNQFDFHQLVEGLRKTIQNLQAEFRLGVPAVALALSAAHRILSWFIAFHSKASARRATFIHCAALIFAGGWLILFSCNNWVMVNFFAWRYFSYAIFALLLIAAIETGLIFERLGPGASITATAGLAIVAIYTCFALPVPFAKYSAFQQASDLTPAEGGLYAGDYWSVWPTVFRDLMAGKDAYGLSDRGDANRFVVREYVADQVSNAGFAEIKCLRTDTAICAEQILHVVGSVTFQETRIVKDGLSVIRITPGP